MCKTLLENEYNPEIFLSLQHALTTLSVKALIPIPSQIKHLVFHLKNPQDSIRFGVLENLLFITKTNPDYIESDDLVYLLDLFKTEPFGGCKSRIAEIVYSVMKHRLFYNEFYDVIKSKIKEFFNDGLYCLKFFYKYSFEVINLVVLFLGNAEDDSVVLTYLELILDNITTTVTNLLSFRILWKLLPLCKNPYIARIALEFIGDENCIFC